MDILDQVRQAGSKKTLLLQHAIEQCAREDRFITREEVQNVVSAGEIIEDYTEDERGHSCLLLGRGNDHRPIHVVCSPKPDFLAVITCYIPDANHWSSDYRRRKS